MTDPSPPVLDSALVGTRFSLGERAVEWRATTNYAAAVGERSRCYFDDTSGSTLIAPPMFAVAVTWPALSGGGSSLDSVVPPEVAITGVHASEHLIFHRMIRAGDRLAVHGRLCSIRPTAAGVYAVIRLDVVGHDGEAVVTEYHGTMYRGVRCSDSGRAADSVPTTPTTEPATDPIDEVAITVDRELPYIYDGCTDIVNPIHTSPAIATERAGLPDIILQGTCTLALAAREVVSREAGGDPARLAELGCRFSRFVIPGTTIRLEVLARERGRQTTVVSFRVVSHAGEVALEHGFARIAG